MNYELSPLPPSLFYGDGSIRKISKAELSKKLESNSQKILILPTLKEGFAAYVIDAMFLIQSMNEKIFTTYMQLAEVFLKKILKYFNVRTLSLCVYRLIGMTWNYPSKKVNDKGELNQKDLRSMLSQMKENYQVFNIFC